MVSEDWILVLSGWGVMTERATPGGYWEQEVPVGEAPLSERDTVVVTNVRHGAAWYVRLQVHRTELVDGTARRAPGQRGLILPVAALAPVSDLLLHAVGRLPHEPDAGADEGEEGWFTEP